MTFITLEDENMEFSHVNQDGKANMVDVSGKPDQIRTARAEGFIALQEPTIKKVKVTVSALFSTSIENSL